MLLIPKNIKNIFLVVLLTKLCVLTIGLANPLLFYRGKKNAVNKFIKAILEEYRYRKKVIKNHFNKTFVLTVDDKRSFKSSNKC